jgi:hypothetical protein
MSTGKPFKEYSEKQKEAQVEYLHTFCRVFKHLFDVDVYLMYGTLLGAVREHDFIDDDNDIDVCYLSKYHEFGDVYKEMLYINALFSNLDLIRSFGEGRNLPRFCGHSHIYSSDKKAVFDVWTSWIGDDGKYYVYPVGTGWAKSFLLPLEKVKLRHREFLVPHKYKSVLSKLYSKGWVNPASKKVTHFNKTFWKPLVEVYENEYLIPKEGFTKFYTRGKKL